MIAGGPVVIVTGAGSGIGRALAMQLAAKNARVALVGRTLRSLQETANRCANGNTLIVNADVSDPDDCRRIVDSTVRTWGRVDVLVNNAAVVQKFSLHQVSQQSLEATFAANTFGPAHLIARCWPHFAAQGQGRIINISSMAVISPFPGISIYAASKAALDSLTRSINAEGHAHNIRAKSIVLGAVETGMLRSVVSRDEFPTEQTLSPDEAANAIANAITDAAFKFDNELMIVARENH